jgi:hypothetical protein
MRNGKPIHRPERLNDSVSSIVGGYAVEYRGVVEYYRMAYNLHEFDHLKWVMETSMTKTLAAKLKVSVPKDYLRFGTVIATGRAGELRVANSSTSSMLPESSGLMGRS